MPIDLSKMVATQAGDPVALTEYHDRVTDMSDDDRMALSAVPHVEPKTPFKLGPMGGGSEEK
jgi:hypothetical protein